MVTSLLGMVASSSAMAEPTCPQPKIRIFTGVLQWMEKGEIIPKYFQAAFGRDGFRLPIENE